MKQNWPCMNSSAKSVKRTTFLVARQVVVESPLFLWNRLPDHSSYSLQLMTCSLPVPARPSVDGMTWVLVISLTFTITTRGMGRWWHYGTAWLSDFSAWLSDFFRKITPPSMANCRRVFWTMQRGGIMLEVVHRKLKSLKGWKMDVEGC